jgi:hypothetical protein
MSLDNIDKIRNIIRFMEYGQGDNLKGPYGTPVFAYPGLPARQASSGSASFFKGPIKNYINNNNCDEVRRSFNEDGRLSDRSLPRRK